MDQEFQTLISLSLCFRVTVRKLKLGSKPISSPSLPSHCVLTPQVHMITFETL